METGLVAEHREQQADDADSGGVGEDYWAVDSRESRKSPKFHRYIFLQHPVIIHFE